MGEGNKKREAKDSIKIRLLINNWVEDREYLKHDISIEKLGKLIGINRTYVSNYINDTYNLNFNTWVHSMRDDNRNVACKMGKRTNRRT